MKKIKLSLTKSKRACDVLLENAAEVVCRPSLSACEVFDYKDSNTPPDGEYLPFTTVNGKDRRYWVKAELRAPAQKKDTVYYLEVSAGISGGDALNPQMIMYLNGKTAHGLDVNHRRVRLEPDTDYSTVCYLYSGNQVAHFPVEYKLIAVNKRVEKLYFDLPVPMEACRDVYKEGSAERNDGRLPDSFSMVSCDSEAVIIDGIKKTEDSGDLIVRMYESFGSSVNCKVKFANSFKKALITNLMERDIEELPVEENSVSLTLKPFEIVTLRLKK